MSGDLTERMDRICAWCSLTWGSHRSTDNRCPGHETQMDWDKGPGTTFIESGWVAKRPAGSEAHNGGWTPTKLGIA